MSLIEFISNVGFPICACVCMAYFFVKVLLPLKDSVDKNTALLKYVLQALGYGEENE